MFEITTKEGGEKPDVKIAQQLIRKEFPTFKLIIYIHKVTLQGLEVGSSGKILFDICKEQHFFLKFIRQVVDAHKEVYRPGNKAM